MRVKSIELIHLKSYERVIIDFSENINLLIGANNSGKSTIIRSLLNLQYRSFDAHDIRSYYNYTKTYTKIVDVDENDSYAFYFPQHHDEFEIAESYDVYWGITNSGQAEEVLYANSIHKIERIENDKVRITDKTGQEVPFKHFPRFPDREDQNNFIYPFLAKRKTDYYDSSINQQQAFMVSEGLRNLASKIQKIGNSSHPMNDEFTKHCMDILGFKIGVIPSAQDSGNGIEPGIYVTNTQMIRLRSMGEGVANIVGFIVTLLTEDNKLYLVEELENDIHPKALKKLLNLIVAKSAKNQFVISTHSHIVLKYLGIVPKSKIFYIDWKPSLEMNGSVYNIPTSTITEVENKPSTRIEILEKLGYDFHDFELHDSYLILEESSAERIIRDFIIPNIVPDLYNKIKTVAAKGVDDLKVRVADFNRLFVFIHTSPAYYKRAWIIADGDKAGQDAIIEIQKDFKTWPKDHFINFTKHNFEEFYPKKFEKKVNAALKLKGQSKRDAKRDLVNEVMDWALKNRETAIKEFKTSAKEVIKILNDINSKLNKKN